MVFEPPLELFSLERKAVQLPDGLLFSLIITQQILWNELSSAEAASYVFFGSILFLPRADLNRCVSRC